VLSSTGEDTAFYTKAKGGRAERKCRFKKKGGSICVSIKGCEGEKCEMSYQIKAIG
jgi:hypothetical protein